jgi:YD repeat-containing protein
VRFDAYGRKKQSEQVLSGQTLATVYGYGLLDRMTGLTDPVGIAWSWTFDSLGRNTSRSDPDSGAWSFEYDDAGRLERQTDAKDQPTDFTYDGAGRLATKARMMKDTRAWLEVLTAAAVFGGGMLLSGAYRRAQSGARPAITTADMVGLPLMGLCFGIVLVFGWHAFSYPLVFITVPALGVVFLTGPFRLKLLHASEQAGGGHTGRWAIALGPSSALISSGTVT